MFKNRGNIPVETVPDPVTGERIHRVAIDAKHIEKINKTITTHQGNMNNFLMFSVSFFKGVQQGIDLLKKADDADNAIKKTLNDITKECKMDQRKPWQYNMQLKCFEYRTAPIVEGMSKAEIEKLQNPGVAPIINAGPSVEA